MLHIWKIQVPRHGGLIVMNPMVLKPVKKVTFFQNPSIRCEHGKSGIFRSNSS